MRAPEWRHHQGIQNEQEFFSLLQPLWEAYGGYERSVIVKYSLSALTMSLGLITSYDYNDIQTFRRSDLVR